MHMEEKGGECKILLFIGDLILEFKDSFNKKGWNTGKSQSFVFNWDKLSTSKEEHGSLLY